MTTADLARPSRLAALFCQAVSAKLVHDSEHARLQFFAAAVHARAVGSRNPAGLFATLVRKGLWHFATHADEDEARRHVGRLTDPPQSRQGAGGQPAGRDSQPPRMAVTAGQVANAILTEMTARRAVVL